MRGSLSVNSSSFSPVSLIFLSFPDVSFQLQPNYGMNFLA